MCICCFYWFFQRFLFHILVKPLKMMINAQSLYRRRYHVYVYVSVFPIEKVDVLLFMDRSYNVLKQLESGGVFFYIYNINFCRIYPPVS